MNNSLFEENPSKCEIFMLLKISTLKIYLIRAQKNFKT